MRRPCSSTSSTEVWSEFGHRLERARNVGQVTLSGADVRDIGVGDVMPLRFFAAFLRVLGKPAGRDSAFPGHVERDADLEQAERGHRPRRLRPGQFVQPLDDGTEVVPGWHRDGEPHVEVVVAPVVVRDAGVRVDDGSGMVQTVGRDAHRHQCRGVSERLRVIDGADLPDDTRCPSFTQPVESFLLRDAEARTDVSIGPLHEREVILQLVEDARRHLVEARVGTLSRLCRHWAATACSCSRGRP